MGTTPVSHAAPAVVMVEPHIAGLVDSNGRPVPERIATALGRLLPQLRRRFPALNDDMLLTRVLDECSEKLIRREADYGPIDRLHAFAWVTLRNVAISEMRRGYGRVLQASDHFRHDYARSTTHGVQSPQEVMERAVLWKEMLSALPWKERRVFVRKARGMSSAEIALDLRCSTSSVDTTLSRAKRRLRKLLAPSRPQMSLPTGP